MFQSIPTPITDRMAYLESIDAKDRQDGTTRMERLRQIPPETGRFVALLAAASPPGDLIEIGTSAGYSTLWLALAAEAGGRRVVTYETLAAKAKLARETFELTGLMERVTLVEADARSHLAEYEDIGFCFLDAEKEVYRDCYDLVIPRLAPGGLLLADNCISHAEDLKPMIDYALGDDRVDSLVVPIGKGILFCRRLS